MTKLTLFLSVFLVLQSFASAYSQTRLSIDSRNKSVKEVLWDIENQSEFRFFYNEDFVDMKRKVGFDIENETIFEIMDRLFDTSKVSYKIAENNLIVIIPAESQQSNSVQGKATDLDNNPLPGVTVIIKGTSTGTVTNMDGEYSLSSIPDNAILVFSFIGMHTQEVSVNGNSTINVVMQQDVIGIEEVVAVGYGTMKKSDLTGSVAQVKSETLESVPVYNMEQALKVGAAGIRVTQNSGIPGGRIEVRIRGGNSMIGDNQPLYVVDGFPVTGGIDFLNPSDIESVDILKDASATAIYGSRGANGVVIITSKRGRQGQKSKIEVNSFLGMQQEVNRFDVLNAKEYAVIANEWLKNQGLEQYFNVDQVQNPGTDWQDVVFRTAPLHNHTITFTGSSEKTQYSVSGNYYDQEGILLNSGVKRGSARINLDHEMNNWLTMGVNMQLSRRERFSVYSDNGYRGQGLLSSAASAPPTLPVYDEDGLPYQIEQEYNFGSADMRNPMVYAANKSRSFSNSVLGNGTFNIKFTPELSFRTLLGVQYSYGLGDNFTPIIYSSDRGSASVSNSYSNSFLNENTLSYIKKFNDIHNLNVVGGYTYQTSMYRSSSISVNGFANNTTENYDLSAAENIGNPGSSFSEWTLASFLGRANYSYRDKYMVTASIRADGSSRFGADHKWGYFPSAALAWRISEESFMQDVTAINSLKLRFSYGVTGNTALSAYQSLNRLSSVKYIYANQADVIGFVPTGISNSNLKWESTGQLDVGFDLNIVNNRLRFVFDYYKKNTKDLLASVPLPPSVGFGSILQNLGEIQNQGIEFSVNADVLQREFKWIASAQISANRNKVIKIAGDSDIFGAEQGAAWPSTNIARVGEPLGAFYGLLEDGLDENGFIKYQDISGPDGEPDGVINALDRVILGSYYPDFIYGFTSDFKYKNLELNIILEGVYGNQIFNATKGTNLNSFQRGNNQFKDIIGNYWTEENPDPNAKYPKISAATQVTASERFIEDGSYLRLKSLRFAYNLPVTAMGMGFFDAAQLYVSGTNLFTITKYSGLDPEVNTRGSDSGNVANRLWMGIDQNGYPNAKVYAIGLKLSF
ncbi:TonB-dependent receptor [Mariniphaga anaerophila]|nr:TonB-dependent receptor [Mariniphaga anaerophila]